MGKKRTTGYTRQGIVDMDKSGWRTVKPHWQETIRQMADDERQKAKTKRWDRPIQGDLLCPMYEHVPVIDTLVRQTFAVSSLHKEYDTRRDGMLLDICFVQGQGPTRREWYKWLLSNGCHRISLGFSLYRATRPFDLIPIVEEWHQEQSAPKSGLTPSTP
jgi:hypothetical protein